MCGIAGFYDFLDQQQNSHRTLEQMIHPITHRGPDGFGFLLEGSVGLAHARLSIIDLEGGWQPITNEDRSLWIIFNGEIFNYPELRIELISRGHIFTTQSDTEVILHLYEEKGVRCLDDLNGQFAIAIYDSKRQSLFLARDRMGIRPLFYTTHNGSFYFGSEIKSLFSASSSIPREIDPRIMSEIFTFWCPSGEESIFTGVKQLLPGHYMKVTSSGVTAPQCYWSLPFCPDEPGLLSEREYAEGLRELLIDAVRLRLRADVPVGAYLSGGLDSSAITSIIKNYTDNPLKTFSVTFRDEVYDESQEQNTMVEYLGTDHHRVLCSYKDIATAFPEVIWHAETPILRTAPTPLFLLSKLVRQNNYKVVLTGEGADEVLGGYDIFKEAKIRAFIQSQPNSELRPQLLKRLYPYLALSPTRSAEYAQKFFATNADITDPFFAHRPRWKTTTGTHIFFTDETLERASSTPNGLSYMQEILQGMDFFNRAQYFECKVLMANYLLSSQGDRMAMANSIEGRYPFLDHRVVEYAGRIPIKYKMKVLNEKNILKQAVSDILPENIIKRKKQPYMAPDISSFFGDAEPDYLEYYLSESLVKEAGLFKHKNVEKLIKKCRKKGRQGFKENMAFVGILSSQILYDKMIKNFKIETPKVLDNVRVVGS
ncbi:asparagine synthase (glutamine-hydrolyzing) [Desulforhopalus sp. IMCC35007]|uniref:asparagine synthase (glutamine-hydrolyzing) n=1 Tax=Desulforhopalus sp. IMCC35007 TaxID=2569543 RepID=UPI0010AED67C|nr:asparagine synthase (glutamine-hydrolyzing) [Desulforhopalus sp. IMCC35007]TKB07432.1 asparagine synthase (glutamine-hydrolyzing) [Desulforhopalus sp. IMCC35007]